MVAAAEASGRVHQVGFIFRYNDGIAELRRRIAAGDIGEPFYLRIQYDTWDGLRPDWQVTWRERYELAAGGVICHVGVHLFDIAHYVLGKIESATGFCFNLPRQRADKRTGEMTSVETDDFANCWFRFASGMRGQWCVSRVTPPFAEYGYVEVIGTEGALKAVAEQGTDRCAQGLTASRTGVEGSAAPARRDRQHAACAHPVDARLCGCVLAWSYQSGYRCLVSRWACGAAGVGGALGGQRKSRLDDAGRD